MIDGYHIFDDIISESDQTKLEEYVKLIRSKGASISQEIKQEIYSEDFENKEKNKDD